MKKLLLLVFTLSAFLACKDTSKETTETTQEPVDTTQTVKTYPLSLAQWSLHKPIFAGTEDPMDFAETAKELGFDGLEYVSQLYRNENVNFPMKGEPLQTILDTLKVKKLLTIM